jgi:hypothetical protein
MIRLMNWINPTPKGGGQNQVSNHQALMVSYIVAKLYSAIGYVQKTYF